MYLSLAIIDVNFVVLVQNLNNLWGKFFVNFVSVFIVFCI